MKKLIKVVFSIAAVIAVCSVVVGALDRKDQKKREEKAKAEGKEIHKPYGLYEKYMKRPLDFFLSFVALIVLSPVMAVTAILIRLKLGSPVFFIQERPGRDERIFKIIKFRTMTNERDEYGNLLSDHDRLTSLGAFLRKSSIDELPELFNVIRSDMSIIGPRPLLKEYLPFYSELEKHRHDVRPGVSGLAQVNGRNSLEWDSRLAFDVKYVDKITFIEDVRIFFKTLQKVLKSEDVAVDSETVEPWFNRERVRNNIH